MTVFTLSGPSCTGKSTLATRAASKLPRLRRLITITTRPQRSEERPGVDYHFVSLDTFKALAKSDRLADTTLYEGHYYGTTKDELQRLQESGDDGIVVVTASGVLFLRNHCSVVPVFVDASNESILARIGHRTDPEEVKAARLRAVQREREECRAVCLHELKNAYLDAAVDELCSIIEEARNGS